jgi:selenocysteine-specific elongation factor
MIIGTAGHIDHGKTTLVRALTGVDTDRLKEEKARGISIELGYAYTPLASGEVLGIIDVPGHERFIHTMAAGASGIDFALLVVAADDGVMPQTVEHLAILGLLGVGRGALALTKADRVDAARLAEVHAQLDALLAGGALAAAPRFALNASAPQDPGVAALRAYLHDAAGHAQQRRDDGLFRLAVDRVFTLAGHGTVVTGTVLAGRVEQGDMLVLAPAGLPVRVRSIHAQNRAAQSGQAGQRCALNLSGIEREQIARGDWIVDQRASATSTRIDTDFTLLDDAGAPLAHWAQLHVHVGAAHHLARVVLIDGDVLVPGQTARVQLVFETPLCCQPGDRFIARNPQATRTVGGGRVLDPFGPARGRRTAARKRWLDALAALLEHGCLTALLQAAPHGLSRDLAMHLSGLPAQALNLPADTQTLVDAADARLFLPAHWEALGAEIVEALREFHARSPDELGPAGARLHRIVAPLLPEPIWRARLDALLAQGAVQRGGPWLHLPEHLPTLSQAERGLADALLPQLVAGGFDPPWVRDLSSVNGAGEGAVRETLRKLARQGELFQVVRDLFYSPDAVGRLAEIIAQLAAQRDSGVSATAFRDATGLGRKRAIQILEFFDRVAYTRFYRDLHWLRTDHQSREHGFWR